MVMKLNKLLSLLIVFVLMFAAVGTALAEEEAPGGTTETCDPLTTDCPEEPEEGLDWVHPIVALLATYMENQQGDTTEPEEPTCDPLVEECPQEPKEPTCDPLVEECSEEPQLPEEPSFVEKFAALHDEGVGFGVLVKLLTLSDRGDTPLTTLVEEFKSGQGFKQLYEDYGAPTKRGVGQVKQELKCEESGGEDCESKGKPGKANFSGEVISLNEDGTITVLLKNGLSVIVFPPSGETFDESLVGKSVQVKGTYNTDGSVQADSVKLIGAGGKPDKSNNKNKNEGKPGKGKNKP
jgi:hypothetical protein